MRQWGLKGGREERGHTEVSVPTKPATVAGLDVHGNVGVFLEEHDDRYEIISKAVQCSN